MPIPDKIAAAKKIDTLLRGVVTHGGLHLKYRITVDPPLPEERDWERPEILVELSGPDSPLVLERGGELLRAIEGRRGAVLQRADVEKILREAITATAADRAVTIWIQNWTKEKLPRCRKMRAGGN